MNDTAERIFKLRKYLGLTQAEFSFPLGIKNSLLSKLERGKLELDEAKAKRIAEFYGVSISWIQNGEEPMFREPADKKQIKEQILDSIRSFQEWISDCPRQSLPGYGERLMSVRKDSGLKQAEFADRTGVSVVQLSRMENDRIQPDLRWLFGVCEQFHVNVRWLYQGIGPMYKKEGRSMETARRMLPQSLALTGLLEKLSRLPEEEQQEIIRLWETGLEQKRKEEGCRQEEKNLKVYRLHLKLYSAWFLASEQRILERYNGGEAITRDILIPEDMTFHALHYAIQRLFGWRNSHLHQFCLEEEDFERLTHGGKYNGWKRLAGYLFRVPTDDPGYFWDDDYDQDGPSGVRWMKKKYKGPYYYDSDVETLEYAYDFIEETEKTMKKIGTVTVPDYFEAVSENTGKLMKREKKVDLADFENLRLADLQSAIIFDGSFNRIRESLPVASVLNSRADIEESSGYPDDGPVCNCIDYQYDFGDDWKVLIELYTLSAAESEDRRILEAVQKVRASHAPVCIEAVGKSVMDDVGGYSGYISFLETINGRGGSDEEKEQRRNYRLWAAGQGWKNTKPSAEKLL